MLKILIVGHADADGHVIAEQMRVNLSKIENFSVHTLVDPKYTAGHRSWPTVSKIPDIRSMDIVFFVDLMFSPASFVPESNALVELASEAPSTRFIVIDHHPLPNDRLCILPNLHALYRPNVFECCIGPKTGLMLVAALDENQAAKVANIQQPHHQVIALGLRRLAAPGGGIAGAPLMSLIKKRLWSDIYRIGNEDKGFHRLVRGRRPKNDPRSSLFLEVKERALELAKKIQSPDHVGTSAAEKGSGSMAYDLSQEKFILEDVESRRFVNEPEQTRDLEAITTLLEIAAISLTSKPNDTFTLEQLFESAQNFAGSSVKLERADMNSVVGKASFLTKKTGAYCLR